MRQKKRRQFRLVRALSLKAPFTALMKVQTQRLRVIFAWYRPCANTNTSSFISDEEASVTEHLSVVQQQPLRKLRTSCDKTINLHRGVPPRVA